MSEHKAVWCYGQLVLVCDGHLSYDIPRPVGFDVEDFKTTCGRCGRDVRVSLKVENIQ